MPKSDGAPTGPDPITDDPRDQDAIANPTPASNSPQEPVTPGAPAPSGTAGPLSDPAHEPRPEQELEEVSEAEYAERDTTGRPPAAEIAAKENAKFNPSADAGQEA